MSKHCRDRHLHVGGVPGQCEAPGRHKQKGMDLLIPPAEGGASTGSAPCRGGYAAISKAAISVAADLRDTLAAGARGAS
jgi:hypothetical protein